MNNWYFHKGHRDSTKRYFLCYKLEEPAKSCEAQLEITFNKGVSNGFRFHLGDRGSETPLDIMISVPRFAIFFGARTPRMGDLFEKIGRGHKRNLSLTFHDQTMWWELWYDDDMGYDSHHRCDSWRKPKMWPWSMGRKKHRPWMCLRHGNLDLNPLDAIFGKRYYNYRDVATHEAIVNFDDFDDDKYEIKFTLQKQTRRREHGPQWVRHLTDEGYSINWDAKTGIPFRNHAWKSDNVLSGSFSLESADRWFFEAHEKLVREIWADRKKHGYQPPKELQR